MLEAFQITPEHIFDLITGLLATTCTGWLKYNQYLIILYRGHFFTSSLSKVILKLDLLKHGSEHAR